MARKPPERRSLTNNAKADGRPARALSPLVAVAIVVLAGIAAYGNSFGGVFALDDRGAILNNPTITDLSDLSAVLSPPGGGNTVGGRPVLNVSLAISYALSGTETWGYHLLNLLIHLGVAVTWMGLIGRLLNQPALAERYAYLGPVTRRATAMALAAALLWAVHPLTTAAVTYIVQRAESLAALWYVLTLYLFLRGCQTSRARGWFVAAAVACALGMATKEIVVTAPVAAVMLDRVFVAKSWRELLTKRWLAHAMLAASWLMLLILAGGRGDTAGGESGVSPLAYAATQFGAVVGYIRRAIVPTGLVFDYGTGLADGTIEIVPPMIAVIGLLAATVLLLIKRPPAGAALAAMLLVLAPTSTVVPVATQTVAEHRFYLPLAPLVTLVVGCVGWLWFGRAGRSDPRPMVAALVVVAICLAGLTHLRNRVYFSRESLWRSVIAARPGNDRAYNNLAETIGSGPNASVEDKLEALELAREAGRLNPQNAQAFLNQAAALLELGRPGEAIEPARRMTELAPGDRRGWYNLGRALAQTGQYGPAIDALTRALELTGPHPTILSWRGRCYLDLDQPSRALEDLNQAIGLSPNNPEYRFFRAGAYYKLNQYERAWADVEAVQAAGLTVPQTLIDALQQAAPPEQ